MPGREVRVQCTLHSVGDLPARRFGCRTAALCQDRTCDQPLAEPARKIDLTHRFTESAEDSGCHCRGESAINLISAEGNEDEKQGASRAFCTPPLDGQEMPEGHLVVSLTRRSARKPGVARKGIGNHRFPVSTLAFKKVSHRHNLPTSKTLATDRLSPTNRAEASNSFVLYDLGCSRPW